ncbi:MAG: esterase family protein [Clostridiales bacterium]|jgi:S-formylglutathione hydrolase FrmB|nr:esterase family protein [Clostridiales bacterium]
MAYLQMNFFSYAVGINTCADVILPQDSEGPHKTLYLLHGYSDNHAAWHRRTSIERYADRYKIAVIMPDAQKSFYSDFVHIKDGYQYWKYVSEELLDITRRFFKLSHKRDDTYVAGLSMGGFGAFKLALNKPEVFGAGASLSGAVDSGHLLTPERQAEFSLYIDVDKHKGSVNDLFAAAQRTNKLPAELKPRLYQACGTEDFLYQDNIGFRDFINTLDYDYTYTEGPGAHTWDYWDFHIEKVLEWLNLEKV